MPCCPFWKGEGGKDVGAAYVPVDVYSVIQSSIHPFIHSFILYLIVVLIFYGHFLF